MRKNRRTQWVQWGCDLEGCEETAATHKDLGDPDIPPGWEVIEPPAMWRGPSLAFCSKAHKDAFVAGYVRPLLEGGTAE